MGQGLGACSSKDGCTCTKDSSSENGEAVEVKREPAPGLNGSIKCLDDSSVDVKLPAVVSENLPTPTENAYWEKKGFDFDKATEDVYAMKHFSGPNRDIRPLLDYTYHKKYTEERVMLQDRLIQEQCAHGSKQEDLLLPWVIFTAGAMGAGKGFVIEWMNKNGCLPLDQFLIVDPDVLRQELPEWKGYVAKDPLTAALKTQKEAGHIAEILGYKALKERWNVIFDGSLRDVEWYKVYFQKLRHAFPGIRLMILHIQAEREAVLRRAAERGRKTGRMVPRQLLESSMDAVPKSVEILSPYVDVAIRVINAENQEPRLQCEPAAINPPFGIPITCKYIAKLWMTIDTDGDGQLSKSEVVAAVTQGILTEAVLDTVDVDGDGAISKEELKLAIQKCQDAATLEYRNPSTRSMSSELAKSLQQSRSQKWS